MCGLLTECYTHKKEGTRWGLENVQPAEMVKQKRLGSNAGGV